MALPTNEAGIGQLPFSVPLQQIYLRNTYRSARTAVARDYVNREVVPRGGAACGDDAAALISEHQIRLRVKLDLRKAVAE